MSLRMARNPHGTCFCFTLQYPLPVQYAATAGGFPIISLRWTKQNKVGQEATSALPGLAKANVSWRWGWGLGLLSTSVQYHPTVSTQLEGSLRGRGKSVFGINKWEHGCRLLYHVLIIHVAPLARMAVKRTESNSVPLKVKSQASHCGSSLNNRLDWLLHALKAGMGLNLKPRVAQKQTNTWPLTQRWEI